MASLARGIGGAQAQGLTDGSWEQLTSYGIGTSALQLPLSFAGVSESVPCSHPEVSRVRLSCP